MIDSATEDQIKWLVDQAEIQKLISAYTNCLDDRDFSAWQDLFADEGGYGAPPNRLAKHLLAKGSEELLSSYEKTHHFLGLPAIAIDGDEARARCPGITHHVTVQAHPSQSRTVGGWLRFTFRRTESGWRIVDAFPEVAWTEGEDYFAGATRIVEHLASAQRG
ncbi:hypothetical protein Sj15T_38250 [Sphingobium sp. TA15]|uniref:SnoaL-like domain-containing protein n=2 Tax=Sphingobium indicum TaxID=332055 RepID=D4Z8D7_SPHIU|nr:MULTISPECIES: nuclear transport factor 2 family protein [Sphingobium]EPR15215.1 hypothetical protein M527_25725 [Sphingobium indicum IP26]BDD68804.1 hypothetical protein Sj15T_38250 [Sphingobium sp. TA15]EQB03049.1 hypothetical protein L286_13595 [Sphingobium sp. HDIP04]KER34957.1 hypothetical protein AL00_18820 [Sphingobium indicum F2]BAI98756.1 hypothetical protein SJA_C2-03930 [Sphingobium indicum UT26S]